MFNLGGASPTRLGNMAYQQPVDSLEWLTIDLWPDYDRASVLVLLTGSVPADVTLPAPVTLPLPPEATLNAVARISDDNEMIDDVEFERNDGTLTLTAPDLRFRVEYYMPYSREGLQREFVFNWPGGPAVARIDVGVQQPLAATSMSVQPAVDSILTGSDGLEYHNLPVRQLGAAESFIVEVSYRLASEQLTAAGREDRVTGGESTADGSDFNWSLVLAIIGATLLLLAISWQLFGARLMKRRAPRKPRPLRTMQQQSVQFCHACGARARAGDRFCRECGTELKKG